ncbi:MAG: ATP-binding protein [Rhodothalassiaceae bacterium]
MPSKPGCTGSRSWRGRPPVLAAIALSAIYLALHLGLDLHVRAFVTPLDVTPWYPPIGLALAALLVCGRWILPIVVAGFFTGSFLVWRDEPLTALTFLAPLAKAGVVILGAELLRGRRRLLGAEWTLNDLGAFFGVALVVALLSGVANIGLWHLFGIGGPAQFFPRLANWVLGDLLGILILAPVMLIIAAPCVTTLERQGARALLHRMAASMRVPVRQIPELLLFLVVSAVILYVAFVWRAGRMQALYFLVFLPVLWAILRFGFAGAVLTIALVNAAALLLVLHGSEPHLEITRPGDLEVFQLFIIVLALVGYVLGTSIKGQRAARRTLAKQAQRLEEMVMERTQALVEAKRQAEQANRAKTHFLHNMSHELRTPLNAIIGFAEVLEGELLGKIGNRKYRGYASDIAASGRHLASLVDDLLDIASLEAGDMHLEMAPVLLSDVLADSLRMLELEAREKGCEIRIDSSATPDLRLRGDRRRLVQVLLNLIGNAVKFSPEGAIIHVRTGSGGKEATIEIEDQGRGIAAADIPHLFDRFWRARESLVSSDDGIGLGLAIARMLVEQHGGRIEVESEPGKGTILRVILPLAGSGR